jgi:AFG3 family protein
MVFKFTGNKNYKQSANKRTKKSLGDQIKDSLENGYSKYILMMLGAIFIKVVVSKTFGENLISFEEAFNKIKRGEVSKLVIINSHISNKPSKIEIYDASNNKLGAISGDKLTSVMNEVGKVTGLAEPIKIEYSSALTLTVFLIFLVFCLFTLLPGIAMSNGRLLNKLFGKTKGNNVMRLILRSEESQAVEHNARTVNVTFKDVAGLDGPKEEVQQVIDFLRSPDKFMKLGARIPKGVLLAGPPGTGKTLLAKACAGEVGVPFFVASGSEFSEIFVGVGAARVRNLFAKAKEKAPSIIFIDEIDTLGKKRSRYTRDEERESTLNQLFVEMDGFGTNANVIVMAATNRKKALDPALIRPGRFDRLVEVPLPNLKEREEIFMVHLRNIKTAQALSKEELAKKLAALTTGMSGADIMSVCNESALIAARTNKNSVELGDFYEAYDRVLEGLKKSQGFNDFAKKLTAFHEAGHATAGWFLKNAQQVLKVSIVPRSKGSLGHTILMPDELQMYTKEQVVDMLKTMYGGRAAEEIFMQTASTGADNDLSKATELAKEYVGKFGMTAKYEYVSFLNSKGEFVGSPYAKKVVGCVIGSNLIGRCLSCVMKFMRR